MTRILLLLLFSTVIVHAQRSRQDFASRVNPMIGTSGHGHTYPGALVPFGMMQLSPDTRLSGWDGCSGYHYSDTLIYGFSHTHLSGTGCSDYGDILITPSDTHYWTMPFPFSHKNEISEPGYYKVSFQREHNITTELTTSTHCGMHRYTFSGAEPYLHIDLKHRDEVLDSKLEIVDSVTLRGYRFSKAWAANQKIFFEIKFSQPILYVTDIIVHNAISIHDANLQKIKQGKSIHECYIFNPAKPLLVKVAISAVDEEGAHKNMQAEMPGWNFDDYRSKARAAWNKELSKLDARGGTSEQQTVFYTALYHSMSAPNIYSDVDGRYRGRDDKIHSTEGKFDYYTVFSLWDTYRAEHPLLSIIDPKRTADFINTFIAQYEQGGELPVWELSSNETYCMIGYHAVPVIWDAYSKGIRGFDVHKAFEAMKHSAMLKHFGLESYQKYGFVRADDESESVSKTLEYAYDDWCIAQMAWALKDENTYYRFMARSQSWRNVYDPTTGFMRARRNGTLYAPFSPYTVDGNYTEANAWQYSFYVPHDIDGLMDVMGGKKAFESKLDALFKAKTETEGREQADITGLIGQYAHGNEPSHHIAYLYNYVGKPEKTRAIVRHVMDSFYHNAPDGLIGNEDCGQMSAWYVMSAMGIYPVCPGIGHQYEAGQPIFDSVIVTPSVGQSFSLPAALHSTDDAPVMLIKHKPQPAINANSHGKEVRSAFDAKPYSFFEGTQASYLAPAPFIINAKPIFKGSETIALGSLGQGEAIVYSIGEGANFKAYERPFVIRENTLLHFYSAKSLGSASVSYSPIQEARFTKLPDDRSIILHSRYNKSYSAGGPEALIDGQHGTTNWRTGGWQGYQGQDFEGIVAFKSKAKKISRVSASFLEDQNAWIFYPTAVSFYASDDSLHWKLIETIPTNKSDHHLPVTTSTFSTEKPVTARYVKVVAKTFGKMPEWHEGRGESTFIFIDEIEVR